MKRYGVALTILLAGSFLAGVYATPSLVQLPDFKKSTSSSDQKRQYFIDFMLPKIEAANLQLTVTRQRIQHLAQYYNRYGKLNRADQEWLQEIAQEYEVSPFNFNTRTLNVTPLLERVDIIPPSLVLAQAINESAWGTSRFAQQANNIFGQWCFSQGCGLVPKQRPEGAIYEVQKFPDILASVDAYMYNLNTNDVFEPFRELRAQLRAENQPLTGQALASGLLNYSQRHQDYVDSIQAGISNYNLAQYDNLNR
ncbi:MAG: flagellar biosynthesis protein FlgJ [Gammaproteobacteria bacterium]|jgi:Bax protein|nr:flagellar biosynthesis protein FlgJ [Gammaproteobacteria bacterium]